VATCLSVYPSVRRSVCLSHAGILSKRLNISKFFSLSRRQTILVLLENVHYVGNLNTKVIFFNTT